MQQAETITFIIIGNILLFGLMTGIILFIIQFRKRKLLHEKEKDMITEIHAKELLSTQLEMQAQTMQYIGREIHDNVGQKLTLASLYTQQLAYENKSLLINNKIENIGTIINESLAELRRLSKSLTDDHINENDLVTLIQQECDKIDHLKKCTICFERPAQKIVFRYETKSILLRIAQEFIQNSIKHSGCSSINILLEKGAAYCSFILSDDGKGFDKNNIVSKGIGLQNIKKRIEIIGGTYTLDSKINNGTILSIKIPLQI
jgi:signal transduction histidine kinase